MVKEKIRKRSAHDLITSQEKYFWSFRSAKDRNEKMCGCSKITVRLPQGCSLDTATNFWTKSRWPRGGRQAADVYRPAAGSDPPVPDLCTAIAVLPFLSLASGQQQEQDRRTTVLVSIVIADKLLSAAKPPSHHRVHRGHRRMAATSCTLPTVQCDFVSGSWVFLSRISLFLCFCCVRLLLSCILSSSVVLRLLCCLMCCVLKCCMLYHMLGGEQFRMLYHFNSSILYFIPFYFTSFTLLCDLTQYNVLFLASPVHFFGQPVEVFLSSLMCWTCWGGLVYTGDFSCS